MKKLREKMAKKKLRKKGSVDSNKRGFGSSRGETRSAKRKFVEIIIRDTLVKVLHVCYRIITWVEIHI